MGTSEKHLQFLGIQLYLMHAKPRLRDINIEVNIKPLIALVDHPTLGDLQFTYVEEMGIR